MSEFPRCPDDVPEPPDPNAEAERADSLNDAAAVARPRKSRAALDGGYSDEQAEAEQRS